jgi:hypothetical protein
MTTLSEDESWALLFSLSLGRLAISVDDIPTSSRSTSWFSGARF